MDYLELGFSSVDETQFVHIDYDSQLNCWLASYGLANKDFANFSDAIAWLDQLDTEYNPFDYL